MKIETGNLFVSKHNFILTLLPTITIHKWIEYFEIEIYWLFWTISFTWNWDI